MVVRPGSVDRRHADRYPPNHRPPKHNRRDGPPLDRSRDLAGRRLSAIRLSTVIHRCLSTDTGPTDVGLMSVDRQRAISLLADAGQQASADVCQQTSEPRSVNRHLAVGLRAGACQQTFGPMSVNRHRSRGLSTDTWPSVFGLVPVNRHSGRCLLTDKCRCLPTDIDQTSMPVTDTGPVSVDRHRPEDRRPDVC